MMSSDRPIIITRRIILREILPTDEFGLFELDSNPKVHAYLGNKPVVDIEQIRTVIQNIRKQYVENGIGRWAVVDKLSNAFMGWAGLKRIIDDNHSIPHYYDLGYRLLERFWGKGFATEATSAILKYGFDVLKLAEIYSICEIENISSIRVLKKSGLHLLETFTDEGVLHNKYRITREEWEFHSNGS